MLWVVLLAVFSLLFGVWGYLAARSRGRTPVVWALVCAFTFFIGIAIVYSLGDPLVSDQTQRSYDHGAGQDEYEADQHGQFAQLPAVQSPPPVVIATGEAADDKRWRYLCEYHPRISEAVRRIEPMGSEALEELKSAYLALNDATLLPGILRRLDERFGGQLRGFSTSSDFGRALAAPVASDDDEPIDLQMPPPSESLERSVNGMNGLNGTRATRAVADLRGDAPPPARDYRSLGQTTADAEREQPAWRSVFDKDRAQRPDAGASTAVSVPPASAAVQTSPAERVRLTNSLSNIAANGVTNPLVAKDNSIRSERRDEPPAQQRMQAPPPVQVETVSVPRPPEHRTVSPTELVGAKYVETFGGLHLFALADGRVFVDRHEALGSLDLARSYIDGLKPKHAEA